MQFNLIFVSSDKALFLIERKSMDYKADHVNTELVSSDKRVKFVYTLPSLDPRGITLGLLL